MRDHSDVPSRGEIEETLDEHDQEMSETEAELANDSSDVVEVHAVKARLDNGGTAEGRAEVQEAGDRADGVSADVFHRDDTKLEGLHEQDETYEAGLEDRRELADGDAEKLNDAAGRLHNQETMNEVTAAEQAARRDMEFLDDNAERARRRREQSEQVKEENEARVEAARRA